MPAGQELSVAPTIPTRYVAELLAHSGAKAGLRGDILTAADIDPASLEIERHRITYAQFSTVYWLLRKSLDDEMFGWLARPVPPGAWATQMALLTACADIETAIWMGRRFYQVFDRHDYWQVVRRGKEVELCVVPKHDWQCESVFFAHAMLLTPLREYEWLCECLIPVTDLVLPDRVRPFDSETREMFGFSARYEADRFAVRFPASTLRMPIVRTPAQADEFTRNSLAAFMGPSRRNTLEAEIRHLLAASVPFASASLAAVAKAMHESRATLAATLAANGLRFQKIKDRLRRDRAIALLAQPDQSIGDLALAAGFSESSAFCRAFKAWTGLAPTSFRNSR